MADTAMASRTASLVERAERLFPGGVNSPVRAFRAVDRPPLVLERGAGHYVWDADGRRYLDYIGAWGPAILGHAHPAVVEAVMSALRVARAATGRDLVVKFAGAYHGHSDGLLVEAGSGLATEAIAGSAGVPDAVAATAIVLPYNDAEAVTRAFAAQPGRIAAVIVEPVVANAGVIPPLPGYFEHLRDVTRANGALLIFEVITGFRLALGGAQGRFGVTSDLTTLGKIIGGGMPIGAYGGRAGLMNLVAPAGPVYQAGTLSGHPLSMAAGIATLEELHDDRYADLEATAAALEAGLANAASAAGREVAIARVGSLLTVFFRQTPPVDAAEALASDRAAYARFFGSMLDQGILLPPSQFEAWFVSMTHGPAELAATIDAAQTAFAA